MASFTINYSTIGIWVLRLIASVILLQTLFFKFTTAEESVYIFSEIGMEPWGRIGTGVLELIAAVLILIPYTTVYGAILGITLMAGALFFHFTKLGIEVRGDGGLLFAYALLVLFSCIILLLIYRKNIIGVLGWIFNKNKTQ